MPHTPLNAILSRGSNPSLLPIPVDEHHTVRCPSTDSRLGVESLNYIDRSALGLVNEQSKPLQII